ncbi:MAG: hypothetical protein LC122_11660 [Chitinophagales bacterium]|nr:hypothetical protein [Chitinophagales bacterium]
MNNININSKIRNWTIISQINKSKNLLQKKWICICDCGYKKIVTTHSLIYAKSKKCIKCRDTHFKSYDSIPHRYWKKFIRSAKLRKIKVEITSGEAFNILKNQNFKCSLSGIDIYMSKTGKEQEKGYTTASIDRIDSSKSYTIENIQWIHKNINRMKLDFDQKYFIYLCKKVAIYQNNQI